jgi:uncharacterized integral membrane protein
MGRSTVVAVVVILLLAFGALFVVQNSARTTQLSLDLGAAAWQLERPVPIPTLIGVCFGAGLLLGGGWGGMRILRLSSRIRQLEQQAALAAFSTPASSTPTSSASKIKDPGSW